MLYVPRRSPLAFPAGLTPGFDPTHPAAVGIYPGHGFSAVCGPANNAARNLLTGAAKPSSTANTLTGGINGYIGPKVTGAAASQQLKFSGQAAVTDDAVTLAGIVFPTTLGTFFLATSGAASTTGHYLGLNATGRLNLFSHGAQCFQSNLGDTVQNSPFFVAISAIMGDVVNYVSVNLANGVLKSGSSTNASTSSLASDGTYVIGAPISFSAFVGDIAAVAFIPSFLSLAQLLQWAADPWSFWYPNKRRMVVGTANISSFIAAWAMNKNRINSGVAT